MHKWLVVGDEPMLRECLVAIRPALGHEVIKGKGGLEAWMLFKPIPGGMSSVTMDLNLPRTDGFAGTNISINI
jgi:CheY-like chemotaxis protein